MGSPIKWLLAAVLFFAAYKIFFGRPFGNMVSTGWGTLSGLPSLTNPFSVYNDATAYSPPGMAFGPSRTTNGGSAGA